MNKEFFFGILIQGGLLIVCGLLLWFIIWPSFIEMAKTINEYSKCETNNTVYTVETIYFQPIGFLINQAWLGRAISDQGKIIKYYMDIEPKIGEKIKYKENNECLGFEIIR